VGVRALLHYCRHPVSTSAPASSYPASGDVHIPINPHWFYDYKRQYLKCELSKVPGEILALTLFLTGSCFVVDRSCNDWRGNVAEKDYYFSYVSYCYLRYVHIPVSINPHWFYKRQYLKYELSMRVKCVL
jgi:hypothetical protein